MAAWEWFHDNFQTNPSDNLHLVRFEPLMKQDLCQALAEINYLGDKNAERAAAHSTCILKSAGAPRDAGHMNLFHSTVY